MSFRQELNLLSCVFLCRHVVIVMGFCYCHDSGVGGVAGVFILGQNTFFFLASLDARDV